MLGFPYNTQCLETTPYNMQCLETTQSKKIIKSSPACVVVLDLDPSALTVKDDIVADHLDSSFLVGDLVVHSQFVADLALLALVHVDHFVLEEEVLFFADFQID